MISLPQGFEIGSRDSIDSRLVLSKHEMRNINDNIMPEVYFSICKDDGRMYIYQKKNTKDNTLGKYRLYSTGTAIIDASTADTLISQEEGNIITVKTDGLYLSESESIEKAAIEDLFNE